MSEANEVNESPELPDPNYPEGYDPASTFIKDEHGKYIPPAKRLHKNKRPTNYRKMKETLSTNGIKIGRPRRYDDQELDSLGQSMYTHYLQHKDDEATWWVWPWCESVMMTKNRLYEYAERSLSFAEWLNMCKMGYENKIMSKGMASKYSAAVNMGIMALKQYAQWRDKQEITDTRQQVREVSLSVVTPEGTVTDGTLKYGQVQNAGLSQGEDSRKESTGLQESTISK